MKKIKSIRRIGMPETNSSSDHVVIISNKDIGGSDKSIWSGMDITGETKIYPEGFGWEFEKFNDIYRKLQYLSAQVSTKICKANWPKYRDLLENVKKIYHDFCGGTIIFTWQKHYESILPSITTGKNDYDVDKNGEYIEVGGGSVDHQSTDALDYVLSSPDLIKDYLFSPKSWVFGGNDNSNSPDGYFNTYNVRFDDYEDRVDAIAGVDLGQPIGVMEFNINNFPETDFCRSSVFEPLSCIYYKKSDLKTPHQVSDYGNTTIGKNKYDLERDKTCLTLFEINFNNLCEIDGDFFIIYASKEIHDKYTEWFRSDVSRNRDYSDKEVLDLFEDWGFEENRDYIKKPVTIETDKFGKL